MWRGGRGYNMMRTLVTLLSLAALTLAQGAASPYIGGNQFGNYYTNPNLINTFLSQVNGGAVNPACNSIPGVGQPVLAIKQALQGVDAQLDAGNRDSAVKTIFFRERRNATTFQSSFKLVLQLKGFSSNNYVAVEGVYRQLGAPAFEVVTYYVDSNLDNVRAVLGEYAIDTNAFVGCGDVKAIYSQASPALPKPSVAANVRAAAGSSVDPAVVAQVIQLLQKQ